MTCSTGIHQRAAGVDQLCSLMTKTNLDILGNENSVQHLLEICMIIYCQSEAEGRGKQNPHLIKIDSVTSGHG